MKCPQTHPPKTDAAATEPTAQKQRVKVIIDRLPVQKLKTKLADTLQIGL